MSSLWGTRRARPPCPLLAEFDAASSSFPGHGCGARRGNGSKEDAGAIACDAEGACGRHHDVDTERPGNVAAGCLYRSDPAIQPKISIISPVSTSSPLPEIADGGVVCTIQ